MSPSHDRSVTEVTFIRKLKRPDGSAVWPAYHMGEDRFGTWLFTPKGSLYRGERARGGHGAATGASAAPPVATCPVAARVRRPGWSAQRHRGHPDRHQAAQSSAPPQRQRASGETDG